MESKQFLNVKRMMAVIAMMLWAATATAQVYRIGDLYTFPDGSQGIVYHLNPDGSGGWAVALNDASSGIAWGTAENITALEDQNTPYYQQLLNDTAGYSNTLAIRSQLGSGTSYAAGIVDFDHGWYLPSPSQLSKLYSRLPYIESGLAAAGGSTLSTAWYWCSAEKDNENAWGLRFDYGYFNSAAKTSSYHVRAVRSFSYPAADGITYEWSTGDTTAAVTDAPTGTTTYTVTGTDAYGCTGTASFTVTVTEPPVVTITGDTAVCAGSPATLTASGASSYLWSTGDTTATITVTPENTTTYTVTGTNEYGVTGTESASMTVNQLPVIDTIVLSVYEICDGGQITVTASVSGGVEGEPYTFTWYRNNELMEGYTNSTFTVSDLTVDGDITDYVFSAVVNQTSSGCTSLRAYADTLTVNPNPYVVISGDPLICQDDTIRLTANVNDHSDLVDGITYEWRLENITLGSTTNVLDTALAPSVDPYHFMVVVHNENGCTTFSAPYSVLVNAAPIVNAEAAETDYCVGGSTILTSHIIDRNADNLTYQWLLEGDTLHGANEETYTTPTNLRAGTYAYTVLVYQTTSDCIGSADVTITVHNDPTIDSITVNNAVVCDGMWVIVTAHATLEDVLGEATYTWYKNGTRIVGITSNSFTDYLTVVNNDITEITYSAIVTLHANGCTSEEVAAPVVTVKPHATVSVVADGPLTICDGGNVTLTANVDPADDTYTYQWYLDNQPVGSNTNVYVSEGLDARESPYMVHVVVTSAPGCATSTMDQAVAINVVPRPSNPMLTSQPDVACSGGHNGSITVESPIGSGYSYSLDSTSFQANNVFEGLGDAIYTVTVRTDAGCTSIGTVEVERIPEIPGVVINPVETLLCPGQGTQEVTAQILGGRAPITVIWSENVAQSISDSLTGTVDIMAGLCEASYTVMVTIMDGNGCEAQDSFTFYVKDTIAPIISGIIPDQLLTSTNCEFEVPDFTRSVLESATDNCTTIDELVITQSPEVGTIVTNDTEVTITATDACGNTSMLTVNLLLPSSPQLTTNMTDTSICQGNSLTLAAAVTGGTAPFTYEWDVAPDSPTALPSTSSLTVTPESGENTYTVTITDANGCSATASTTVALLESPTANISGNLSFCQGESSLLTVTGNGSYLWDGGSTQNSITVSESGMYSVTVTNDMGCSTVANATVTAYALPNVTISGNTILCQGENTTLIAHGAETYLWTGGLTTPSITVNTFGYYTVTGVDSNGCSNSATVSVLFYNLPPVTISGATDICSGESTTLTASGAETYLWNNGNTNATLQTGTNGTYTVIGTDTNGCHGTASATVTIHDAEFTEVSVEADGSYTWHDTTYTESGDYTWTGQTVYGCDSTVTLHLTVTTGIASHSDGILRIYPNPTNDVVNVRFTNGNGKWENTEIRVYDVYGRLLHTVETCHGASLQTTQIDLSQYATGVYLIQLVNNGNVMAVRKAVKE